MIKRADKNEKDVFKYDPVRVKREHTSQNYNKLVRYKTVNKSIIVCI